MRKISAFISLPWNEKAAAIESACMVALVRCCLWMIPFRWLLNVLRSIDGVDLGGHTKREATLSRYVAAASRYIPGATCLTQAVALKLLLARRGFRSELKIGATHDPSGAFKAHAWLENAAAEVLIGGASSPHSFTPFNLNRGKA